MRIKVLFVPYDLNEAQQEYLEDIDLPILPNIGDHVFYINKFDFHVVNRHFDVKTSEVTISVKGDFYVKQSQ